MKHDEDLHGDAVTLQFDLESEFYQDPADCIA